MSLVKLLRQNSSILPDLQFKKIIKLNENKKTTRLYYRPKIKLFQERNINNILNKEKHEISNLEPEINERTMSNKIINKESNKINDLKEEIQSLKNQLNDEKLKSEVLKEIAEEEQKKHILYKKNLEQ